MRSYSKLVFAKNAVTLSKCAFEFDPAFGLKYIKKRGRCCEFVISRFVVCFRSKVFSCYSFYCVV